MSPDPTSNVSTETPPRVAADIMNPMPRTCSKFSRVVEAVLIFKDEDCGLVPVVEEGKPIGVVTDRDVALAVGKYTDLIDRPITDIMTSTLISVLPETTIREVVDVFKRESVRRLLVVGADGLLVGVIGWSNLCGILPTVVMGQVIESSVTAVTQP